LGQSRRCLLWCGPDASAQVPLLWLCVEHSPLKVTSSSCVCAVGGVVLQRLWSV
jgi:hypothetical protein